MPPNGLLISDSCLCNNVQEIFLLISLWVSMGVEVHLQEGDLFFLAPLIIFSERAATPPTSFIKNFFSTLSWFGSFFRICLCVFVYACNIYKSDTVALFLYFRIILAITKYFCNVYNTGLAKISFSHLGSGIMHEMASEICVSLSVCPASPRSLLLG